MIGSLSHFVLFLLSYLSFGFMNVFIIDWTFRYRIKRPKIVYPLSIGLGILIAILSTLVYETIGHDDSPLILLGSPTEETELLLMGFILLINVIIFVFLQEKWWKKLLLVLIVSDLLQRLNIMFSTASYIFIPDHFPKWLDPELLVLLIQSAFVLFEFLFCLMVGKINGKNNSKSFPLPLIFVIDIVVGILSEIAIDGVFYSEDISKEQITVVLMLLSLSIMVVGMYISNSNRERRDLRELNSKNEEYINAQTMHFEKRAAADTEVRAMRHDMRNNVQVLMLLLEKGEYDKMREYLEEMGEGLSRSDVSLHTGSAIADAIISEKIAEAGSKGIDLTCSGVISGVEFTPVDTCKILANILDNAIEACGEDSIRDLPQRTVELQFKRTDNHFMICCTNPSAHYVDISDDENRTTKKDKAGHGFGVHNIRTAAANYGGELMSECKETPYGYDFCLEMIFPVG